MDTYSPLTPHGGGNFGFGSPLWGAGGAYLKGIDLKSVSIIPPGDVRAEGLQGFHKTGEALVQLVGVLNDSFSNGG